MAGRTGHVTTSILRMRDGPCTLERAFALSDPANHDIFLIRVRRAGGSVTLAAPTTALSLELKFGTYVQGNTTPVKGTIQFTGTFTIAAAGVFRLDPNASVEFADVTVNVGMPGAPRFSTLRRSRRNGLQSPAP